MPTWPDMKHGMRFSQSMFAMSGRRNLDQLLHVVDHLEGVFGVDLQLQLLEPVEAPAVLIVQWHVDDVFWQAARKNMKEFAIGMPRWPFQAMP